MDRIFPNLRQIPQNPSSGYGGYYLEAPFSLKRFALHCCAFLCKLVQLSNFGGLKSTNGHILDRLFLNLRQIPKNPSCVYGGHYFGAPFPLNIFALQCRCFFCKLVQRCNFGRLNSINEHILERLFPNLGQIPKNPTCVCGEHYFGAPFPLNILPLQCSTFSVNWCKYLILVG